MQGRKRRNVCPEEVTWGMKRRTQSVERRTAQARWREMMGRYGMAHIAHGGDILDTG
jgi:hypothetical protein